VLTALKLIGEALAFLGALGVVLVWLHIIAEV